MRKKNPVKNRYVRLYMVILTCMILDVRSAVRPPMASEICLPPVETAYREKGCIVIMTVFNNRWKFTNLLAAELPRLNSDSLPAT